MTAEQSLAGILSRTFFVKVRLDGFCKTCDAGYFDPVPTLYPPAVEKPLMQFQSLANNFEGGGYYWGFVCPCSCIISGDQSSCDNLFCC